MKDESMSNTRKFHLGWFANFCADAWNDQWGSTGGLDWTGRFYIELAEHLERAKFDYLLLEDKLMVSDAYGGSFEHELKHALHSPKHDPAPLIPLLGHVTNHLGLVVTLSSTFYPPFLLARLCSTLDHITGGRLGWNMVTSAEDRAAQNFGLDELPRHDERYSRAHEYVELVRRLWDSWEPDAVVRDRATDTFVDYTKVHTVNFEGQYYRSRGPLNTVPSPQLHPVLAQAGGSPQGKDFAAKYADTVVGTATDPAGMISYRNDIRRRAIEYGRSPDDIKVLFLITPHVADTDEEARAKLNRIIHSDYYIERTLAHLAAIVEIDFSKFDFDKPLPDDLQTNGERGSLEAFLQRGSGKTLRELTAAYLSQEDALVGTPASVADRLENLMAEVGGDGFLITAPGMRLTRKYVIEIVDGLVPELQRRGLTRTEYEHRLFRENLLSF
jgi:FMN-dependent oxidoreductase (nitrilotriacetate monooxygenase family)